MANKLQFVALTTRNKMPPEKMPRGRLRQSEVFFPLAIVAHHVVPPGICPGLIQNHPDFRLCHRHFRIKCGGHQQCLRRLFGF